MRRFTGIEKCGLALAIFFVIGGTLMIVHPVDMFVVHPDKEFYTGGGGASERVSREKAREIGGGTEWNFLRLTRG